MESPSEKLAKTIVERLMLEGLITVEAGRNMQAVLASGNMKVGDWRLPVELALAKEPTP